MENIVTLQFDIQAPLQQTPREFQLVLRNQVTEWLRDTLSARGVENLHLPYDGSSVEPLPGHQIRTEEQDSATHRLTTVKLGVSRTGKSGSHLAFHGRAGL